MSDNFTDDITELLVRYMDNELLPDEKVTVEKMLHDNAEVNEHYQFLLAAKQAIRHLNLKQRVQTVHNEYINSQSINKPGTVKIVKPSFFKTFLRVAAIFVAIIAGYGVFEYSTTTDQSVYDNNFIDYQLPVNRGTNNTSNIDSLYSVSNYVGVVKTFEEKSQKNQQDYFIVAQSYLQLGNTGKSIQSFLKVKELNDTSAQKYFVDETDYYLAMAYIKSGNIDDAENLLNKITSDKQNLYYNNAKKINSYKLRILKLKQ